MTNRIARGARACVAAVAATALTACGGTHWVCPNRGFASDGHGTVVYVGDQTYDKIAPNAPGPVPLALATPGAMEPTGQRFGVAPSGRIWIARGDYDHPNRATIADLTSGRERRFGDELAVLPYVEVASDGRFLYAVQPFRAEMRVARLGDPPPVHFAAIRGARTRLRSRSGLAFTPSGLLCAHDNALPQIVCFRPGARGDVAPSLALNLSRRVRTVYALAVDGAGNYVVTGTVDGRPGIAIFGSRSHGTPDAVRAIVGEHTGLASPYRVAAGRNGMVFVLDGGADDPKKLLVFTREQRGDVAPKAVVREPFADDVRPNSVAFERMTNRLIVVGDDRSLVVDAGTVATARPVFRSVGIRGGQAGQGAPGVVAISTGGDTFEVYDVRRDGAPRVARVTLRNAQLGNAEFVSVARDGTAFFASASHGAVVRYAADATGDASPIASIELPHHLTKEGAISGFAAGSDGTVYVAEAAHDVIDVLAANGTRRLEGPHTGLARPGGMAVDRAGRLFVANRRANSVTMYGARASGDAAPLRTVVGSALHDVRAVALDDDGTMYVFGAPEERDSISYPNEFVAVVSPGANGATMPRRMYTVRTGCFTNDHI